MDTLDRAWGILSRWTETEEEKGNEDSYIYEVAMNAVCGLCEFVQNYSR
jgi:hypothetical protein